MLYDTGNINNHIPQEGWVRPSSATKWQGISYLPGNRTRDL